MFKHIGLREIKAHAIFDGNDLEMMRKARLFDAFSHPVRLRIMELLYENHDTITVEELVDHFNLEQPTISHHLRVLRDAGLVKIRKDKNYVYYSIRQEMIAEMDQIITTFKSRELAHV